MAALLEFDGVSFCYPHSTHKVLQEVSFSVEEGEFVVLCGASGCGKTTLLRHILKSQIPVGVGAGTMRYRGESIEKMDDVKACTSIAYVGQDPENGIVTERVWQELAFGLESLGLPAGEIRSRTGEMAEYFGISRLFRKETAHLSGGQKQLLNLAAAMVMQPELLVLDEPTSQLDPIGAERFIDTLLKLHRDFGVTIFLCEQRLEQVLAYADKVLVMEQGSLQSCKPRECGKYLYDMQSAVFPAVPVANRVALQWHKRKGLSEDRLPLTIREGRQWLGRKVEMLSQIHHLHKEKERKRTDRTAVVLEAKKVEFAYEKDRTILEDFELRLQPGMCYSILGGNGSGKSTALKLLSGIYEPRKGSCYATGKVCYLPQNAKAVFSELTVEEELFAFLCARNVEEKQAQEETEQMLTFMELQKVRFQHPYDLSGGQAQRLAIAKALLCKPEVLLLDEPTKGLDASFKDKLGKQLRVLCKQGLGVVLVSHDLEFCAQYATHCGLLFDGRIISEGETKEFFEQQYFYVPAATRMARGYLEHIVTAEEILQALEGTETDAEK